MTINHLFVMVTASKLPAVRSFYQNTLQTLGYKEMIVIKNEKTELYGFGSDYPYLWLKPLLPGVQAVPTHVAIDGPGMLRQMPFQDKADMQQTIPPWMSSTKLLCEFALHVIKHCLLNRRNRLAGGIDNGFPGIRSEMSKQPYYAGFVLDPDGNNIEAVCVPK